MSRWLQCALPCVLACALTVQTPAAAGAASETYDWHEGADGYAEVLAAAKAGDRPLLLLFSVDWCGYCRRLSREYLDASPFDDLVAEYLRVVVDPDDGPAERAVADTYGVKGFPTFLVLFAGQEKPRRIGPFRKDAPDLTPEQLTEELKEALAWSYCTRGVGLWKSDEHRRSIGFFEAALALLPDYAWGAYGLGVARWRAGRAEGDAELLRRGEQSLVRALEIKPGYEAAERELAQLRAHLGARPAAAK